MIARLKSRAREFSNSKPGDRFKDFYYRRQERPGHLVVRIFLIIFGTVLAVGSLFTAPLPGPGFATVFLGLAILAGEFLPAARFLDWCEVHLRRLWQFIQRVWRSGTPGKIFVVAAATAVVAVIAFVVYVLFFGG